MEWLINGLPAHPLLVHFVVIVIPLAGLCLLASVAWPAARRRLGVVTPLIALAGLISVPLATQAGEALEEQVGESSLVEMHAELGDTMLPWAIGLFVVAVLQWVWFRWFAGGGAEPRIRSRTVRRTAIVGLVVAAVVVAVGAIVSVVVIGESGARAVWGS